MNGKTVFGLTEKKAEIRKLPFCPASRREAGFFVPGRTGNGRQAAGRERGTCCKIPSLNCFSRAVAREDTGAGNGLCGAFLSVFRNRSQGAVPFGRGGGRSPDAGFAGAVFFVWRIRAGGTLKAAGNGGWGPCICRFALLPRLPGPICLAGMRGQGVCTAADVASENGDRALWREKRRVAECFCRT